MMKMSLAVLLLGTLLCCNPIVHAPSAVHPEGVFIISTLIKHPATGAFVPAFPDDSIFCSGAIGIEQVMMTKELIHEDKLVSTSEEIESYFLIDFRKQRYTNVKDLQSISKMPAAGTPFDSMKLNGFDFGYKHYNNESYTESDTTIDNVKYQVIKYQPTRPELKGNTISLLLVPMPEGSFAIIPSIEETFKGRLSQFEIANQKGEVLHFRITFQPGLNNYWKSIFKKLS